ncbi:MAG: metallophosphoesterase [Caldisericia bacterium]|nr:metallophosphoesterase [Caldisericia bacterium]
MNRIKQLLRRFWKIISVLLLIAIVLDVAYKNKVLSVETYYFSNRNVPSTFDGFKILQLSDLHNYRFGKNQCNLIEKINGIKPDLIVFTGDLIERRYQTNKNGIVLLEILAKSYPVYFVSGNHEEALGKFELIELKNSLKEASVIILDNEWDKVDIGNESILIVGLRDAVKTRWDEYQSILSKSIDDANVGINSFTVVLAHRPEFIREYANAGVDLVLSGHTHGGQIKLPFIGGIYAPNQGFFPKYIEGEYDYNGTHMIISRGLGASVLPLRVWNPPEITVIVLQRH